MGSDVIVMIAWLLLCFFALLPWRSCYRVFCSIDDQRSSSSDDPDIDNAQHTPTGNFFPALQEININSDDWTGIDESALLEEKA
mmetsp:Transcript_11646/g.17658  ORF Transcript_11646/g.17658 Transcript_11646/m.17658 type:complete len:84 (-) Transcript_11646:170-421(-)